MESVFHRQLHVSKSTLPFIIGKFEDVVQFLAGLVPSSKSASKIVLPVSLNDLAMISSSDLHAQRYTAVNYCTTDGMPLVWWAKLKTRESVERVYGPDILHALISKKTLGNQLVLCPSERVQKSFSLMLQKKKLRTHVELDVIGKWSDPAEQKRIVAQIKRMKCRVVWIGIGSPNQVGLAAALRSQLPTGVLFFCVGAAVPFFAGLVPQAPRWVQQSGLEWLFRLVHEPRRLWKRYLIDLPIFLYTQVLERILGKKVK